MSNIGKQIIHITEGTSVTINNKVVSVKGKLGELKQVFNPVLNISIKDDEVIKAADEAGISLVFTCTRHFKH